MPSPFLGHLISPLVVSDSPQKGLMQCIWPHAMHLGDGVRVAVAPASVLAFLAARYRLARSAAADGAADDAGGAGTAAEMAGGGATCTCCPS